MRSFVMTTVVGALAVAACLVSTNARADVGVCGALASESCEFVAGGGCTTRCEPLNMTATCGVQCSSDCTASAAATCADTCATTCAQHCTEGVTHCTEYCESDCWSHCSSSCTDSECEGQCEGACTGHCSVECEQDPPDCATLCQTSCNGSCEVQADIDCYISCESSCTVDLTGGCKTDCEAPFGALFCDGQYVQLDNYSDCAASFNLQVQGSASIGCSAAPPRGTPFDTGALAALAAGAGLALARRRARK